MKRSMQPPWPNQRHHLLLLNNMHSVSFDPRSLAISIVSHGQGRLVRALLEDLTVLGQGGVDILVTLNIPEDEAFLEGLGYQPRVIRNQVPQGFGANHNHAYARTSAAYFAVLNPDIRCDASVFAPLMEALADSSIGVAAPRVTSSTGENEDSIRRFPSTSRIGYRVMRRMLGLRLKADYDVTSAQPMKVDWAAGMFLVFDSLSYKKIGGFDEGYFMYLEDADICRRLGSIGKSTLFVPSVTVIHDAQRASRRSFKHFRWHMKSMLRCLFGSPRSQSVLMEEPTLERSH